MASPQPVHVLQPLLEGFQQARSAWEAKQVALADDFNLLQAMGVAGKEAVHSKILAWLLDRRLGYGSHAQGNLGFRLFVEELEPALGSVLSYPDQPYWVRCEVSGRESRVDIEIAARGEFIIHIENKIWATEGENQTHREWGDLERKRKKLGVPKSNVHGIFLTLDGSQPKCKDFVPVGWHHIVSVLDRFAEQAQPAEVKLFVAHYAKAVRRLTLTEPETEEHTNEDPTV